jgi:hypothetical protein
MNRVSSRSSRTTVSSRRIPANARSTTTVSTVLRRNNLPVSRRPPRNRRARIRQTGINPATQAYLNTLRDPFEYPPVRVGFGTMVPTDLYTYYQRFTFTVGTDGSFSVLLMPVSKYGVSTGALLVQPSKTANFTTASANSYSNIAALDTTTAGCMARVVSCGVRVIPQVPSTSAPGICYAGDIATMTPNECLGYTPTALSGLPNFTIGRAMEGASVVSRPVDPSSYQFEGSIINGGASVFPDQSFTSSTPVIIMTGLPAGSTVLIEAVLNVETIRGPLGASLTLSSPERRNAVDPGLSSVYSNVESLWHTVMEYIPSSATVNQGASIARAVGSIYRRVQGVSPANRRGYYHEGAYIEEA